jgi:hypothetical protein
MKITRRRLIGLIREAIEEARFSGPFTKFEIGDTVQHTEKPEKGLGLVIQCKWGGRNVCVKWKNDPELRRHYPYVLEKYPKHFSREMRSAFKRKAAEYEKWAELAE